MAKMMILCLSKLTCRAGSLSLWCLKHKWSLKRCCWVFLKWSYTIFALCRSLWFPSSLWTDVHEMQSHWSSVQGPRALHCNPYSINGTDFFLLFLQTQSTLSALHRAQPVLAAASVAGVQGGSSCTALCSGAAAWTRGQFSAPAVHTGKDCSCILWRA